MNHLIAPTPSVSPSSTEIGLDRQLRQIYGTPHLTPREVKRLFEPIVREREIAQGLMFAQARNAAEADAVDSLQLRDVVLVFASRQAELREVFLEFQRSAGLSDDGPIADARPMDEEAADHIAKVVLDSLSASSFDEAVAIIDAELDRVYGVSALNGEADALADRFKDLNKLTQGGPWQKIAGESLIGESLVELCARAGDDAGLDPTLTETGRPLHEELVVLKPVSSRARQRLMEGVQQYVVKIARKHLGRGLVLDDLIQEGNIGLMTAIGKFDPSRGFAFLTYANDWIYQAMGRACTNSGSLEKYQMRIPCHMYMAIGRVQKHRPALFEELGREPLPVELAKKCRQSVASVEFALEVLSRSSFSLDAQSKMAESDATVGDFIPDEDAVDPLIEALRSDQRGSIQRAYRGLTDEEQQVLLMRLNLADRDKPYTQEAICTALGIKKSRMLNIERRALNKLEASLQMRSALGDPDEIV